MSINNIGESVKSLFCEDKIKFFAFLGVIALLTGPLMDIIRRSWGTELMSYAGDLIKKVDPSGTSIFINIFVGIYIASIILLFVDRYKRAQALSLLAGILIIIYYMSNNFIPRWNVPYVIVGAIVGAYLGGGFEKKQEDVKEYKKAAKVVSSVSIIYILAAFLTFYLSPDQSNKFFIKDVIVVLAFSYVFRELMNYELKGSNIFVLGPGSSGKTLLMVGCYMSALDAKKAFEPSEQLTRAYSELLQKAKTEKEIEEEQEREKIKGEFSLVTAAIDEIPDDFHIVQNRKKEVLAEEEWLSQTLVSTPYSFLYESGKIFVRRTVFNTIDYPGPYIDDLLDYFKDRISDSKKELIEDIINKILIADKVIFVVDYSKNPNYGEVVNYTAIIKALKDRNKSLKNGKVIDSYIVVTKSDILMDEFRLLGKSGGYHAFKIFVEGTVSQNGLIKTLLADTKAPIYPVFYFTKEIVLANSKRNRVPVRDNKILKVFSFGFDKLVDDLVVT